MSSVLSTNSLSFTGPNTSLTLLVTNSILNAGNTIIIPSTTASVSSTTGALVINGGLGLTGNLYVSGTLLSTGTNRYTMSSYTSMTIANSTATELTTYFDGGEIIRYGPVITQPSSGRLQVNIGGMYMYTSGVVFSSGSSGARSVWIGVNGSSLANRRAMNTVCNSGTIAGSQITAISVSSLLILQPGDYVSTFALQTNGTSLTLIATDFYPLVTATLNKFN